MWGPVSEGRIPMPIFSHTAIVNKCSIWLQQQEPNLFQGRDAGMFLFPHHVDSNHTENNFSSRSAGSKLQPVDQIWCPEKKPPLHGEMLSVPYRSILSLNKVCSETGAWKLFTPGNWSAEPAGATSSRTGCLA